VKTEVESFKEKLKIGSFNLIGQNKIVETGIFGKVIITLSEYKEIYTHILFDLKPNLFALVFYAIWALGLGFGFILSIIESIRNGAYQVEITASGLLLLFGLFLINFGSVQKSVSLYFSEHSL
jgi:hypothetical protein